MSLQKSYRFSRMFIKKMDNFLIKLYKGIPEITDAFLKVKGFNFFSIQYLIVSKYTLN